MDQKSSFHSPACYIIMHLLESHLSLALSLTPEQLDEPLALLRKDLDSFFDGIGQGLRGECFGQCFAVRIATPRVDVDLRMGSISSEIEGTRDVGLTLVMPFVMTSRKRSSGFSSDALSVRDQGSRRRYTGTVLSQRDLALESGLQLLQTVQPVFSTDA